MMRSLRNNEGPAQSKLSSAVIANTKVINNSQFFKRNMSQESKSQSNAKHIAKYFPLVWNYKKFSEQNHWHNYTK